MMLISAESGWDLLSRSLFDDSFAGIHQLEWFDWSLLIPYFLILSILSIYGVHRYEVIRTYLRHRTKLRTMPDRTFEQLPPVTIQLPLYNERYVVERLLEAVCRIDYPRDLLQIQVLDDSTDETHPFTGRLVGEWAARGYPIEYHHRENREGFKAGALQEGLKSATGELVAIFDADFVPPRDFLTRTVGFFTDPQVGVVQSRWTYLNRDSSLLTEVQAMLLDAHFVLEHAARCGRGLFFNFNGTAGILRRSMIEDAGGWQHDTLTEDSDLSYRAQLKGWRFVYVPDVECPSELPADTYAFQVQQSRWAKGLTQVARKLLPTILRAPIPLRTKVEAFLHLTPNIAYPLMLALSALMLPVMIVRFYMGWFQMVTVDLPLIIASFWSISVFYVFAQKELSPGSWKKSILLLPFLIAAGIGLTVSNTRAVLEALLGVQTAFVRTPKFALGGQRGNVRAVRYRSRSGWLPYIELGIGSYFVVMVLFAIDTYNFFAIPFLLLFVSGYYWAGFSTLYQEWRARMRWKEQVAAPAAQTRRVSG
ncbi:MAG: glycosyltransferase family 2 protein [Bryobacterales bacterium]|nr:glycosyltransferase family 2 protein [Bryobacterales bacterium]MEB2360936.1 glycosyltransferase family 2 protein [Bryobacterales bacterium]